MDSTTNIFLGIFRIFVSTSFVPEYEIREKNMPRGTGCMT